MGRSRRTHAITLTRTRKHLIGADPRSSILTSLRQTMDTYDGIYVLSTGNLRNTLLKSLRTLWRDSRLFFGRKKLAQVALGRTPSEEYLPNLHPLSTQLHGQVGLLFTNRPHADVLKFFARYAGCEYARAGNVSGETVVVAQGALEDVDIARVPELVRLGVPARGKRGGVVVEREVTVCEKGDVVSADQARVLQMVGRKVAEFRVDVRCWYRKTGEVFGSAGAEDETIMTDAVADAAE